MARINFVGFDTGDLTEAADSLNASLSNSVILGGLGYSLELTPSSGSGLAYYSVAAIGTDGNFDDSTTFASSYSRFYVRFGTFPSSGKNEQFYSIRHNGGLISEASFGIGGGDGVLAHLRVDHNGNLSVFDGSNAEVGSSATSLSADTWYKIEWYWNNTTGATTLKINGATEVNASSSSVDPNQPNVWACGKHDNEDGGSYDAFYDHWSIDSSTFPGEGRIILLKPESSGTFNDWTPNTGSDWTSTNEVPPNADTSYISTSTTNAITTFNVENTNGTALKQSAIRSAKAINVLRASSGTPTVKSRIRSSSTNLDNSTAFGPSTTYQGQFVLANTNPSGGSAWTSDSIDNAQVGIVGLGGGTLRVTASYLSVEADPNAITAAGGALGGSSGRVAKIYARITGSGGAVAGSTARIGVTYKNVNATGGAVLAGTARFGVTFTNVNATGGAVLAGSARVGNTMKNYAPTGGAVLAGSAIDFLITGIHGGLRAAGDADVGNTMANYITDGGVLGAGDAYNGKLWVNVATGGAVSGSTAICRVSYRITITGGAVLAGTALNDVDSANDVTGGAVVAGAARVGNTMANYAPTGGAVLAGQALFSNYFFPSGGITIGGDSINVPFFVPPISGGAVLAGSAPQNFFDYENGTGGSVAAGVIVTQADYFIEATGGSVAAGISIAGFNFYLPTSGGSLAAGAGVERYRANIRATGGAVVAGSAINRHILTRTASGGARPGGTARLTFRYTNTATGGIKGGGTARVSKDYIGFGGVLAGGFVPPRVEILIVPAGVRAGGSGHLVNFYYVPTSGGVVGDGRGRIARLRALNPVKTGIGRTLAGDNILKPKQPGPILLQPFGTETPEAPDSVRTKTQGDWNEITESNDNVLPPIVIRRQRPYLPPKRNSKTATNVTQIAQLTTA